MAERATASDRLGRILYLLPAAAREGGARLGELADALGVSEQEVLDDLYAVTARAFYHPAGGGDDLQITIEGERIRVWTTGEFQAPVRLSPREAMALGLAVRARAAEASGDRREELTALAERLEEALAGRSPEAFHERVALGTGRGGDLRDLVRRAADARRRCRIRYWKPADQEPTDRVVRPYRIVLAEGVWYLIGHCERADDIRVFRLDRVLEAEPAEGTFEPPEDFDPADWIASGGKLYSAESDVEVAVRYSPKIARWLREREAVEEREDGSVVVRHRVADPTWLVRHVLRYGPDAEVLEPEEMRAAAADAAARLLDRFG